MKRQISIIIILVLLVATFSPFSYANSHPLKKNDPINTLKTFVFTPNESFDSTTDDTVIAYLDGLAITKEHMLKYATPKENSTYTMNASDFANIQSANENVSDHATTAQTFSYPVPIGISNVRIDVVTTAPQFGQTVRHLFLSSNKGAQLASKIEVSPIENIISFLSAFIPKIGAAITTTWFIHNMYRAEVAGKIRSFTDYGKKIEFRDIVTTYGSFYAVFEWAGYICTVPFPNSDVSTSQVKFVGLQ